MNQYTDEIEKINYYKQRIIKNLSQNGIFPDNLIVEERLKDIDTALAILQYIPYSESEMFDTDKFNEDFQRIYDDLLILYKLAYQICIKDFEQVKTYAETHLLQLEDLARKYEYKTKFEIDSTYLGNTIFFQANGFDIRQENGIAVIELGKIEVNNASKLACMFQANNIEDNQVVFSFDGNNCSPYSYNKDFFTVNGDIKMQSYSYNLPDDLVNNTEFEMAIDNFRPNANNKYVIYGGNNMIYSTLGSFRTFYEKQKDTPISLTGGGKIVFYVINGSFISFNFSKQPVKTNFNGTKIDHLNNHHKIVIEYYGDFTFDYVTDGKVYAVREIGIMKDNKLYYPNNDTISDFLIEEYTEGNKTTYDDVTVTISDSDQDVPLKIGMIAIKELVTLDGILDGID